MGGRGKTPTVACVARLLIDAGERPAILSRGYRRTQPDEGVVVVSDGRHLRADLARSGDEPLLLARRVPGAAVLVCDVRATAAALAETRFGATVHLLDDGFQHWSMRRDIDLVIISRADLDDRRMPFGRLRSPVSALRRASAVLVDGPLPEDLSSRLAPHIDPVTPVFTLQRTLGAPWWIDTAGPPPAPTTPVVALAGIAAPDRFVRALEAAGWQVADLVGFPDHHAFTSGDLTRVAATAAGRPVVTTEKDAMRLLARRPLPVPVAAVPLTVTPEPADAFRTWLLGRIAQVRA